MTCCEALSGSNELDKYFKWSSPSLIAVTWSVAPLALQQGTFLKVAMWEWQWVRLVVEAMLEHGCSTRVHSENAYETPCLFHNFGKDPMASKTSENNFFWPKILTFCKNFQRFTYFYQPSIRKLSQRNCEIPWLFHDLKTFSEMQWLFQAWNPNFKYNNFWLLTVWTLVSPWHFVLQFQVWISLAKQSGLKNEAMHVLCLHPFYFLLLSLGFRFHTLHVCTKMILYPSSVFCLLSQVLYILENEFTGTASLVKSGPLLYPECFIAFWGTEISIQTQQNNLCGNYKICEYQRDTVSQSFFFSSVISHSSDLLP